MPRLGFQEQKLSRSVFSKARDDSPNTVFFTNEYGFSAFSSTSGSVERCSFESDRQDHDHDHRTFAPELSKHLPGCNLLRQSSSGSDLYINRAWANKSSLPIKNRDEAKGEDEVTTEDPALTPLSLSPKDCVVGGFRSEAFPTKYERQRKASLDLNNRLSDATSLSPRFIAMKKAAASCRGSGTFPSPGAPNYRHANGSGTGLQKGWCSERVPSQTNLTRRHANGIPFLYHGGRTLPSKWEDAEKWIFSPSAGDSVNRPAVVPPPQRRPKSKSGPLGPQGMTCCSASLSPSMLPVFDGRRVGNFLGSSPFSTGVLGVDMMASLGNSGIPVANSSVGGSGSYAQCTEPSVARAASVHGWSLQSSLPSSEDEKPDTTGESYTIVTPVTRKDAGTQMSPEGSLSSLQRESPSSPPSSIFLMPEVENQQMSKLEIKDVEVDDCVTVTRWSKKQGSRGLSKGSTKIMSWRKKAADTRSSDWEVAETTKNVSKFKREEAKITAWENLQKAKAEADIQKLEMKLEKIRSSSMDKIMNKLRYAQRKAEEMRTLVSAGKNYQISGTSSRTTHKSKRMSSLIRCFTHS